MRINIAKVCLVKSIGGLHCKLLLIAPFLFFKFLYKPKFMTSRKSLSKYLMNTIDKRLPNSELLYKHDIGIFINETWQK